MELHGGVPRYCPDTQITFPESHKYYEQKIRPHTNPSWSMAFTYAGSPNLMRTFNEKFAMKQAIARFSVLSIAKVLEDVLSGAGRRSSKAAGLVKPYENAPAREQIGRIAGFVPSYSGVGGMLPHSCRLRTPPI